MICPGKICKQEIPDDSLYCDQCGIQILRCSKCGYPGTSKFCGKCGGQMVFQGIDAQVAKPAAGAPNAKAAAPPLSQPSVPAGTVVMPQTVPAAAKKVLFCHPDGWNMEITDGDILGRTNGNHTDRLGSIPVISGTHAKVTCENGAWFITDMQSTNKTYVGGMIAKNGSPVKIKSNDIVQLANVKFIVREA